MTPDQVAWVAGLFEGEGSVAFVDKNAVQAVVHMTDEDVIRRLHSVTGLGQVYGPRPRREGWKPVWEWVVCNKDGVTELLTAIRPWMASRRGARIDAALERLARNKGVNRPVVHGTNSGYQMERHRKLPTCAACKAAHAETVRAYSRLRP